MIRFFILYYFASVFLYANTNDKTLISGFNYGVLPTNVDLVMTGNEYTFSIALLACTCAFVFWLGWNSYR